MPQIAYWRCRNSPLFAVTILGTDTSVLTQIPASIISSIHAFTGMSWPVTIISTTLAIRTITYPFTRNASFAGIRLVAFQPELESISVKEIQATEALDKIRLKELAIERQRIYAANCQPRDMLLPLYVSAPLHVVLFAGLWNLGHASPMAVTSMAWIPHLGYPDPVGILPVAVLAMTQLSLALSAGVASNPSYSHAYNGARILNLVSSPILFIFPSVCPNLIVPGQRESR
jgi:membrane protein insertase Oxa1/YidC/SpoIIIJ